MSNTYFMHCATCAKLGAKPLSYVAFIAIVNQLGE